MMQLEITNMEWRLINSRFPGKCAVCGGEIEAGAQIYWQRRQAVHVACLNGQKPAEEPQNQPTAQDTPEARPEPREERAKPLAHVRYVAPGEPEPDAAEWEFRKTSKKQNRVYVRRPVTLEMVRKLTLEVLSQIKPEVTEIIVKVADRPAVRLDAKVHEKFAEILDLAA